MKRLIITVLFSLLFGAGFFVPAADFNGDGTEDISVFNSADGLWAIAGITRFYFGGGEDRPVPGDFAGDGTARAAIFRASSGLWGVRGLTRLYFGGDNDAPIIGDLSGDGTADLGIYRGSSGLWRSVG